APTYRTRRENTTMVTVRADLPDRWAVNTKVGKHTVQRLTQSSRRVQALKVGVGRKATALNTDEDLWIVSDAKYAQPAASATLISKRSLRDLNSDDVVESSQLRWLD